MTCRWPLFWSALVLLSAAVAVSPVRDVRADLADARLRLPFQYIILAPLCTIFDALSTLSVRQHIALVVTVLALHAVRRAGRRRSWRPVHRALLVELASAMRVLLATVGVYAAAALVDRPMAALELSKPSELAVDFHSHTDASHDGRPGFSAERNRAWHRAAGFDVAYVSDHLPPDSALTPLPPNAPRADGHTILLPGFEFRCHGMHIIALGGAPDEAREWCDACRAGTFAESIDGPERSSSAVFIATLPAPIDVLAGAPISAVELVDAAPRALDQIARDEQRVVELAARRAVPLVASSNLHGWGRTAIAWTVLEIPGWRELSPDTLDARIRAQFRGSPDGTMRVIERRRARPGESVLSLVNTVPSVAWNLLVTLSPGERLSWMIWIWLAWLARRAVARMPVPRRPSRASTSR